MFRANQFDYLPNCVQIILTDCQVIPVYVHVHACVDPAKEQMGASVLALTTVCIPHIVGSRFVDVEPDRCPLAICPLTSRWDEE